MNKLLVYVVDIVFVSQSNSLSSPNFPSQTMNFSLVVLELGAAACISLVFLLVMQHVLFYLLLLLLWRSHFLLNLKGAVSSPDCFFTSYVASIEDQFA
jgi:hypothetical protein